MSYLLSVLADGLAAGCIYALLAIGFAIVYGVLRLLNFAHSEVFTAGVFIAMFVIQITDAAFPAQPLVAIPAAFLASGLGAGLLAMLIERVAYRPVRNQPQLVVLLTAIGMSILLKALYLGIFGAYTRAFPSVALPGGARAFAIVTLILSFAGLWVLVHRTAIGLRMRAVSGQPEVAVLMGIDPDRVIAFGFFLGGFCAGIAGVVWGVVYGTAEPQMGYIPGLKAFIIAVIGSIGRLDGTFAAAVLLGLLEALITGYLPADVSAWHEPMVLALLLLALAARPSGLLGSRAPAKV